MAPDWYQALEPEFKKQYFLDIKKYVIGEAKSQKVYPARK
jgi:uracil DNA glycosylase